MNSLIAKIIDTLNPSVSFHYENTGYGLRFYFPSGWRKGSLKDALSSYQYIILQQLFEAGDAVQQDKAFHVDSDVLCRLDDTARKILNLPEPWSGRFELVVQGNTASFDFSLALRAGYSTGVQTFPTTLEGPFLKVEGKNYLPNEAQWTALYAIEKHSSLSAAERKESNNIWAVHALQQAYKAGCQIDLRQFAKIDVKNPERIGISVVENSDGSLRLIPDFGQGLSPDAVEARLGQIQGSKKEAILRVGNKLILLDERRLQAVNEIISSRHIPAKRKRQFYETPSAFLNTDLVDLDMGFSMRVHGIEIFKKAYFGLTESFSLEWFSEKGIDQPDIIHLLGCAAIIDNEEHFNILKEQVHRAASQGRHTIEFNCKTILLPENMSDIGKSLESVQSTLQRKLADPPIVPKLPTTPKNTEQITMEIDKNDDFINIQSNQWLAPSSYNDDILFKDIKYNLIYKHQEFGIRWIVGLMQSAIEGRKEEIAGGLLADDMGLGKTFMVLAALNIYRQLAESKGIRKPMLAVMPVVLLENWKQEIDKAFTRSPFEDVIVLQSAADLNRFKQEGAKKEHILQDGETIDDLTYALKIGSKFADRLDMPGRLVLTNYDTLRDYQISLCLVDWGCVIFDEAQSLPPHLTVATLKAVNELCARYQMSMVFSTATQPSFDAIPDLSWMPQEILPDGDSLYNRLRRVEVDWRLEGRVPLEDIAQEMQTHESVCGIFNIRKHARTVFERMCEHDSDSSFLISTDLCPAHRIRVVEEIRSRLAEGKPCRAAATQCIEAGVDLDFRVLYRALAPLDSIIQAAGRCNRNGNVDKGMVVVFEPDERCLYPRNCDYNADRDNWYENAAKRVKEIVRSRGIDLNDPQDIRRYYGSLLKDVYDKKQLSDAIRDRDFAEVEAQYKLISDAGEKVIVPYSAMRDEYDALRQELLEDGITPALMKQAAPLTVTVFKKEKFELYAEPILTRAHHGKDRIPSGYWLLRRQYEDCYTERGGLKLPADENDSAKFGFMY